MGWTSFFSDFGHEMATAVLPAFLVSVGGTAELLGLIEGFADASISFMKLFSGWYSDRIGARKPFALVGYFLTALGVGSFALATAWPHILGSRVLAWLGRGTREPPRDALLADSAQPASYGKVFGFHRMMDTFGAILGPALAVLLIRLLPLRAIFVVALVPSLCSFFTVALFVREKRADRRGSQTFRQSIGQLPGSFRRFLVAVGIFGVGNFADSLLIMRTSELLSPARGAVVAGSLAILLYALHNVLYAACSLPVGYLADRVGKKPLLAFGYFLTGVSALGFVLHVGSLWYLGLLFLLAGIAIGITDGLERSVAADFLPADLRGTGYGVLAAVNGIGDFLSSAAVGFLWTAVSPLAGFGYGAVLCVVGSLALFTIRR